MDNNLNQYQQNMTSAANEASKLQQDIPGLLQGLKTNLTGIFAKDNPMMQARETAMTDFLNIPSATRSSLLTGNMPVIEGSPLTLSPTQQDAIVTARRNAALVPLVGLNESIVGQYGNLGEMLGAAGNMYQAQVQAAQQRASLAQQLYANAYQQAQDIENKRRWEVEEARKSRESSGGGYNLLDLFGGRQFGPSRPNPADFDEPDLPAPVLAESPTNFRSANLFNAPQSPGIWDTVWGWLGATPKQKLIEAASGPQLDFSGYNFGNVPIKLGV